MPKFPLNLPQGIRPSNVGAAIVKEFVPKIKTKVGQDTVLEVRTNSGPVRGLVEDGVAMFKGVPFAEPPLGRLRFLPPVPVRPWDEPLECFRFRESAVPAKEVIPGIPRSECCLFLNIWAPENAPQSAKKEKLPVLVFIHGGGFSEGSPAKFMYDGMSFAKNGVVQVNIAYRLGALGFMAFPEVRERYGNVGNNGLLDQIEALRWLRENIGFFGGDAENITICGESAGAFSVSCLMMSPLAKGLFKRAIMESGNLLGQPVLAPLGNGSPAQAMLESRAYQALLCAGSLREAQKLDVHKVAHGCPFVSDVTKPLGYSFWPVFDGTVLPENPFAALQAGEMNDVDILAGYNSDEGTLFVPPDTTEERYLRQVSNAFGERAYAYASLYPVNAEYSPVARACKLVETGLRFGSDLFADALSARGNNVYFYRFDYTIPILEAVGLGAMHALELVFVFNTMPKSLNMTEEGACFQHDVHMRWLNFVKTGDPNQSAPVLCEWPRYTVADKQALILKEQPEAMRVPGEEDVAVLRKLIWEA